MQQYDLFIVLGIVIAGLSIPSVFGALADRRAPLAALFALLVAAVLIGIAVSQAPGVYDLEEVPHAFVRVVAAAKRLIW